MSFPTGRSNTGAFAASMHERDEDVAPGVSRVRPASFRTLSPLSPATPADAPVSRGTTARRAYLAPAESPLAGSQLAAPAGSPLAGSPLAAPAAQTSGQQTPMPRRATGANAKSKQSTTADLEQQISPLRGVSRELVARGMPSALVSELLAEIIAEYGNQVLVSERDARLALVEQLMLRIPTVPLIPDDDVEMAGTVLVTGPSGAGKSVLIAHLALAAARRGQQNVALVNTVADRIGAAAQMNALASVFGYPVEHTYTPQELRALRLECGPDALLLVEIAGWSPSEEEALHQEGWRWSLPQATHVVCVPALAQGDDAQALLIAARHIGDGAIAVLSKSSEARNALPALGALALQRQPVGMVVPGPNLADDTPPPELADVARAALGVSLPKRKKGRSP